MNKCLPDSTSLIVAPMIAVSPKSFLAVEISMSSAPRWTPSAPTANATSTLSFTANFNSEGEKHHQSKVFDIIS